MLTQSFMRLVKTISKNRRFLLPGKQKLMVNLALLIFLIPFVMMIITPYLWMLTASLKERGSIGEPPYLYPTTFDFSNYQEALKGAPFARYYLNTTLVAVTVVASRIFIGGMAAYAFTFLKFPQ
jgi:multiple sugar transport system permease protein